MAIASAPPAPSPGDRTRDLHTTQEGVRALLDRTATAPGPSAPDKQEPLWGIHTKLDAVMALLGQLRPVAATPTAPPAPPATGGPMDSDPPLDIAAAVQLATPEQLRATLVPLLGS